MSTANWRIVLFWTKVGVACIGLLSVVICICLTPGFPDILLLLVAASLWSLISSFFIFIVTNNRSYEHWILHLSFEVSNIAVNFIAFLVVIIFIYIPSLGPQISRPAGKSLALFSSAFTLISSLLWSFSSVALVIGARKETTRLPPRRQDVEIHHTKTWPLEVAVAGKHLSVSVGRTPETTEISDTSSRGELAAEGKKVEVVTNSTSPSASLSPV